MVRLELYTYICTVSMGHSTHPMTVQQGNLNPTMLCPGSSNLGSNITLNRTRDFESSLPFAAYRFKRDGDGIVYK